MIEHTLSNNFPEIRDAIRALCAEFPDEYFRKIDEQRAYPETFEDALTKAGWLAALIPQEYGGSGLGLTEASVIMEEINRCGGNSGRSEEHTSELQSPCNLVCRLLLEKKIIHHGRSARLRAG